MIWWNIHGNFEKKNNKLVYNSDRVCGRYITPLFLGGFFRSTKPTLCHSVRKSWLVKNGIPRTNRDGSPLRKPVYNVRSPGLVFGGLVVIYKLWFDFESPNNYINYKCPNQWFKTVWIYDIYVLCCIHPQLTKGLLINSSLRILFCCLLTTLAKVEPWAEKVVNPSKLPRINSSMAKRRLINSIWFAGFCGWLHPKQGVTYDNNW